MNVTIVEFSREHLQFYNAELHWRNLHCGLSLQQCSLEAYRTSFRGMCWYGNWKISWHTSMPSSQCSAIRASIFVSPM